MPGVRGGIVHVCVRQECIPVGCVLPAAVAVGGRSASVHAGIHLPPGVGLETPHLDVGLKTPPDVGLETPHLGVGLETPQARPLNFPLWCGPGDPPGCGPGNLQDMLGYHPWRPAASHAEIPPAMYAGIQIWEYYN